MGGDSAGVLIVLGSCATGVVITMMGLLYSYLTHPRRLKGDPALREELQALREEMVQLRRQNHDLILSFDQTLQRLDQRVEHVEERVLPAVTGSAPENQAPQLVGRQY
jgi:hypothetical protein